MPTFDNRSIKGIIDKIHAELPCLGTVADKSIKGIIDRALAAGKTINDISIKGIIDELSGFSCFVIPTTPHIDDFSAEFRYCGQIYTYDVPAGLTKLKVTCIGGGGGGAATHAAGYFNVPAGGGGGGVWSGIIKLPPVIESFTFVLGCGGTTNNATKGSPSYIKINDVVYCQGNGGEVLYPGSGGGQFGGSGSYGFNMNGGTQTVGLTGGGGGTVSVNAALMNASTASYGGGGGGGAYNLGYGGSQSGVGGLDYDGVKRTTDGGFVTAVDVAGGNGSRGGGGGLAVGGSPASGGSGVAGGTGGTGIVRIEYSAAIEATPDGNCDLILS